jgi:hypothetical protein
VGQSGEPSFQIQKDDFGDLEAMAVEEHRGLGCSGHDKNVMREWIRRLSTIACVQWAYLGLSL